MVVKADSTHTGDLLGFDSKWLRQIPPTQVTRIRFQVVTADSTHTGDQDSIPRQIPPTKVTSVRFLVVTADSTHTGDQCSVPSG